MLLLDQPLRFGVNYMAVSFTQGFMQLLSKKPEFQRQLNKSNITPKQRDTFNLLIGLPKKKTKSAVKVQQRQAISKRSSPSNGRPKRSGVSARSRSKRKAFSSTKR